MTSLSFTFPFGLITTQAPPPVRSTVALDSHRSVNPTVNCACEGSRLCASYENRPKPAPCPQLLFVEKLSSVKPVPGAKMVGDCCLVGFVKRIRSDIYGSP